MFGKLLKYNQEQNRIIIEFENKIGIVTIVDDGLFNFKEEKTSSFAVDLSQFDVPFCQIQTQLVEQKLHIGTGQYEIVVEDDFMVTIFKDKKLLSREVQLELSKEENVNYELLALEGHQVNQNNNDFKYVIHKVISKDDALYGLGDKTGYLNKRGYEYEMWNTDNPDPHEDNFKALYKSIPFYITHSESYSYGFFFDNTYKQHYDMAKSDPELVTISLENGYFNYWFIGGESLSNVVENYTFITGREELPALWTLGNQQCRWSYMNKEEVFAVLDGYEKNHIPCDVIFLDIDYMERYKVFTTNNDTFSNFKEFVQQIHDRGFKLVTIIDPGVKVEEGYDVYEHLIKEGLVATLDGKTYINQVWPGDSVFPTFINPKTQNYWSKLDQRLLDLGVDGIWNDMNEPASFKGPLPMNVEFSDGKETHYHDEIHNIYGHYMAKATYEGIKDYGKRPYIITRAAYAGTQKYSTAWTGDNHSLWSHLAMSIPQLCNLGLSGFSFVGCDVGGFGSDCTKELLCRWIEAGVFSPLLRNHSAMGTRRQEPWTFDEETTKIYQKTVNLRYELIPYLYDLHLEASESGLPLMRPMVLEFDSDKNTFEINDQYMLGSQILVSPVIRQGDKKKLTYLPKGNKWYDYYTKEEIESGYAVSDAPLDKLPIYIKEGAILPKYPVKEHIQDEDTLILEIYPGYGKYLHYQDIGEGYGYEEGEYNLYEITHEDNLCQITLIYEGYTKYKHIYFKYYNSNKLVEIKEYNKEYKL